MSQNPVSKLAKLMADEKVIAILKATKNKAGLTSKEISQKVHIPTNQLYYTIKKMTDEGLLEVTQKKSIKNFQEFYYSSYQMTHHDPQLGPEDPELTKKGVNISAEWVEKHSQAVAQMILFQTQQFLGAMQSDVTDYATHQDINRIHAGAVHSTWKLSLDNEKRLWQQIIRLINETEVESQGEDTHDVHLLIEKWVQDSNNQK
ncbi:winged helix-turn-helix domain-containing protein [Lentilactobacillus raoultii]|uniref:Winged helix-turn-helix domain-containing protein n=1 Tax=Lentilactobacillus raoultii TaxID=1987503 RepID=A0ABW3PLH8_9LACO|nr:helix-turn-helix domain-containing protein [Lentilactobacillus raoultii]